MANKLWRGDQPDVAQVDTATVGGTVEIGDKFLVTINAKVLTVSATTTSTSTTATEIATAFNALSATSWPEFAEITAAANGSDVTFTADTAGKPFTLSVTTTESNGDPADAQTWSSSTTTANNSKNDWNNADNWSPTGVPANGDDVFLENSSVDILYGLDQSAVTLTSFTQKQSFTGKIGLPRHTGSYWEYRNTYLAIGATTMTIGAGAGAGSGRIKINTGAVQTTLFVYGTGSPLESGLEALLWKGTHASNAVNIHKGSVGIAVFGGETATVATLRVAYLTNRQGDAQVRCGSGVTLTTVHQDGGNLEVASALTTLLKTDGSFTTRGGAIGTVTNDKGEFVQLGTGTITTLNVGSDAVADYSRDLRAKTVTNCNLYERGSIRDPFGIVVWTNGIVLVRTKLPDVDLDVGNQRTLTIA